MEWTFIKDLNFPQYCLRILKKLPFKPPAKQELSPVRKCLCSSRFSNKCEGDNLLDIPPPLEWRRWQVGLWKALIQIPVLRLNQFSHNFPSIFIEKKILQKRFVSILSAKQLRYHLDSPYGQSEDPLPTERSEVREKSLAGFVGYGRGHFEKGGASLGRGRESCKITNYSLASPTRVVLHSMRVVL